MTEAVHAVTCHCFTHWLCIVVALLGERRGDWGLLSHNLQTAFMGVNLGRASTIPAMGRRLSFSTWYTLWAVMLSSTVPCRCGADGSSGAEGLAIGDGLLGYGLELALISVHVYETILTVFDTYTITAHLYRFRACQSWRKVSSFCIRRFLRHICQQVAPAVSICMCT